MQNSVLKLVSVLCVAMLLLGVLAACANNNETNPDGSFTDGPFFEDPTGGSNDDSTQSTTDGKIDNDSSITDGKDNPSAPFC